MKLLPPRFRAHILFCNAHTQERTSCEEGGGATQGQPQTIDTEEEPPVTAWTTQTHNNKDNRRTEKSERTQNTIQDDTTYFAPENGELDRRFFLQRFELREVRVLTRLHSPSRLAPFDLCLELAGTRIWQAGRQIGR